MKRLEYRHTVVPLTALTHVTISRSFVNVYIVVQSLHVRRPVGVTIETAETAGARARQARKVWTSILAPRGDIYSYSRCGSPVDLLVLLFYWSSRLRGSYDLRLLPNNEQTVMMLLNADEMSKNNNYGIPVAVIQRLLDAAAAAARYKVTNTGVI